MDLGKIIIFVGLGLVLIGFIILIFGKITPLGRLPGDIFIKKENFTFYFPLTTCIFISLVFSLIMFLFSKK